MKKPIIFALCAVLVILASCSPGQNDRAKLREKLDEEFEEQTEEIMWQVEDLNKELAMLISKHKEMDKNHAWLDKKLDNEENPDPVIEALQRKHLEWESGHKQVIADTQALIEQFEKRHAQHEEMEKTHDTVPLEQIREEHEQFEKDLKKFKEQFESAQADVQKANQQMDIIFDEHREMEEMLNKRNTP